MGCGGRQIIGAAVTDSVHNHHNFAWRETRGDRELWVARKGATPAFPGPREAIRALDSAIPKDWDIVGGSGHQAAWLAQLRGRPAERFTTVREFGAVGNGLSYALGVA